MAETLITMPSRGASTTCCELWLIWMSMAAISRSAAARSASAVPRLALVALIAASNSRAVRSRFAFAAARLARELS